VAKFLKRSPPTLWWSDSFRLPVSGGQGEHLVLRAPYGSPELKNLAENLEKRITDGVKQQTLTGDLWLRRLEVLQEILKIPERHQAWHNLNKGTHDEPYHDDFEVQVVRQTLDALTKISATFDV
jgi:hypothetical protein